MSEQNNNQNPGQPQDKPAQQPPQPYQPYQGQAYQPYQGQQPQQPYQGQAYQPYQGQQSYQPYQGQAYQPYQGQQLYQPYKPYTPEPPAPPKKKSKWWIWVIVAAALIITAGLLLLFGVIPTSGLRRAGNEGAWKAYDYFDSLQGKLDSIMSANYKQVSDRSEAEAFEIEGDIDIKSNLFKDIGLGIDSLSADFEIKYDLKDLGIKLKLINLVSADIYLIEEDFVIDLEGEAYALPLDPDTDTDLGELMPLKERMEALNSFAPGEDFGNLAERVMAELAPAIPNELTKKETVKVYSPLAGEKVEMKATTTTLDEEDLYLIITTFGENLEQNEELLEDLQDFIDTVAEASGEDLDVDDIVENMIELEEGELDEIDDFTLSWSVYEYQRSDIGISVYIENAGDETEVLLITEFTSNAVYVYAEASFNGDEMFNITAERAYSDEIMTVEMDIEINIPSAYSGESRKISVSLNGESVLEKDSSTEYVYSAEFEAEADLGIISGSGMEGSVAMDIEINADYLFGDDLGMLEDDDDWNEIYDKDWGDMDDLLNSLLNLGGLGSLEPFLF